MVAFLWRPIVVGALLLLLASATRGGQERCGEDEATFQTPASVAVHRIPGAGYGFSPRNRTLSDTLPYAVGVIFFPAEGVGPDGYAPFAGQVAALGYYAAVLREAAPGPALQAMLERPELESWSLVGHGSGGALAARVAGALQPKVKAVMLMAAAVPADVDLAPLNLFTILVYGGADAVVPPAAVESSMSRAPGDAWAKLLPGAGHDDFAYPSACQSSPRPRNSMDAALAAQINERIILALRFAPWFAPSRGALSFGDNRYLTPGFADSKPYPGDIRVKFEEIVVAGSVPRRVWWVFVPSEVRAGLVYFSGAAVDGRAYFPLAFQMAARGHLVVIPQIPARDALGSLAEAGAVMDSDLPVFSGVPKRRWAIAGHSLGGYAAESFAACFGDKIYGAVLHSGVWASEEYNTTASEVPILQIFGLLDFIGGPDPVAHYQDMNLPFVNPRKTSFSIVSGANHYQVGDYGYQYSDGIATISLEVQHGTYARRTVKFLDGLETRTYAPVQSGPNCSPAI